MKYYYLDYAATTPLDKAVKEAMSDHIADPLAFGNSSSQHCFGVYAKAIIDKAKLQLANLIKAKPSELIWTSGATESINLALIGVANALSCKGKHIITSSIEHKATLETCQKLTDDGFEVTYLRPDAFGVISLEQIKSAIKKQTILLSVSHINNEIGVVHNIAQISKVCIDHNIIFHVDAAQSLARLRIDLTKDLVDFMSFSGHKIYGPKGIGALYCRYNPSLKLRPLIQGGGQQGNLRSGTLASLNILGMGKACEILQQNFTADREHIIKLSKLLMREVLKLENFEIIANFSDINNLEIADDYKIYDIVNILLPKVDKNGKEASAHSFMQFAPQIAISAGSACSAGSGLTQASHVLSSLRLTPDKTKRIVRVSLGRMNKESDILALVKLLRDYILI